MDDIAKMLRKLRRRTTFTLRDIAYMTKISENTIGKYEAGTGIPSINNLEKILNVYGLKLGIIKQKGAEDDKP